MSPTQISEALFAFIVCIFVGLFPGLMCAFTFFGRRAFRGLLWNNNSLIPTLEDVAYIVGMIWPFVVFPVVAAWLDGQLEYYFPYGGLQPGWVHFAFATFPVLFTIAFAAIYLMWLPLGMRLDQAQLQRERAERYY